MKCIFLLLFIVPLASGAQAYEDSVNTFIKKYVDEHEVVKGDDKKKLQFYPVNKNWRVKAVFEKKENSPWFMMPTSGKLKQEYRVYGVLSFTLNDTACKLNVYQSRQLMASPQYANYLFLPFTDRTSGIDTYGAGRYIDLVFDDISDGNCTIDFNKAYNPYCAYVSGYNCPIPPKENDVPVTVTAGEKNYAGH